MKSAKPQRTQKTPTGLEIPIPKRGDVFRDLEKATRPQNDKPKPSPEPKP